MKEWIAGKLLKLAFSLMDRDTKISVIYLLQRSVDKGIWP